MDKRFLVVLAVVFAVPATGTTLFEQKFVCPVGGEKFKAMVIGSMTTWGQRPDGMPYGTTTIVPLTECPRNGFIFFEEKFDSADIDRLTPLVLGTEYQSLRQTDTPHFRAWWLMSKLDRDPFRTAQTLLVASWESDADKVRKSRYQRAYIAAVSALPMSEAKKSDWFWLNLRSANLLRELEDFKQSDILLAKLDQADLLPNDTDSLEGVRFLIDGLRLLNADRNAKSEPTNLIPAMVALDYCSTATGLTPAETHGCKTPEVEKARRDRAR